MTHCSYHHFLVIETMKIIFQGRKYKFKDWHKMWKMLIRAYHAGCYRIIEEIRKEQRHVLSKIY